MISRIKSIPLPVFLFGGALAATFLACPDGATFFSIFNRNFAGSLGYFCMILLPSFLMASCLAKLELPEMGLLTKVVAPFSGAGMICPDTAYAAVSPMAGAQKRSVVLGTYAGFKLLPPAGPLIIATALGLNDPGLLLPGFLLLIPVWISGELFLKLFDKPEKKEPFKSSNSGFKVFIPLIVTAIFIVFGIVFAERPKPLFISLMGHPAGALLIGGITAWLMVPVNDRKACMESALDSTGRLVLLIGLSTALGRSLAAVLPVQQIFNAVSAQYVVLTLFFCAAVFKSIQGSSMATFAAVAPVTEPIINAAGISPALAVYSLALGSFVCILPNDSFYWLSRQDAYKDETDLKATIMISSGSVLQAVVGLLSLFVLNAAGWI